MNTENVSVGVYWVGRTSRWKLSESSNDIELQGGGDTEVGGQPVTKTLMRSVKKADKHLCMSGIESHYPSVCEGKTHASTARPRTVLT